MNSMVYCNTKECFCINIDKICNTRLDRDDGMWYDVPIKTRAGEGPKFRKVGIALS